MAGRDDTYLFVVSRSSHCEGAHEENMSGKAGMQLAETLLQHEPFHNNMSRLRQSENLQHLAINASLLLVFRPPTFTSAGICLLMPPIAMPQVQPQVQPQFPNLQFDAHIDLSALQPSVPRAQSQ
jgi:hypothetical protein